MEDMDFWIGDEAVSRSNEYTVNYPIRHGIVENWDVSMRMLQRFLDPTHGWRGWHNDDRRNVGKQAFSTASVLRQLGSTDELRLAAYVSRERALYAAAVAAHRATCRALLGARDRGCNATIDPWAPSARAVSANSG